MTTDISPLNDYIRTRSAAAFSSLASQHTDWIYSAALRMVHDPHTAEDITQAVFLLLAEHPEKASDKSLSGWLFKVTRYCAANALRAKSRRAKHERQAAAMITELLQDSDDPSWSDIAPLLETAVARLRSSDRDLVLQRFYQNKSLADIGLSLNISEDAARKRVAAVIEKLRSLLKSRGITATALALLLTQRATHAAPMTLKAAINTLSHATSASHSAILLANGAKHAMLISKIKLAAAVSSAVILLGVSGWLALNSFAAGTPSPAPTIPAIAATATAPASADLSTPMSALMAFFTATKNGDNTAAYHCLVTQTRHEPTLIEAAINVDLAQNKLLNEAEKAFGSAAAASLHDGTITLESVAQLFNTMGTTKTGLTGDTAEMSANIPATVMNMVPAEMRPIVASWSNAPIHFMKEPDGWKFDLNHSMRVVMDTGVKPEKPEKDQIAILQTEAEDIGQLADSIQDGNIPTAPLAQKIMHANDDNLYAAQKIRYLSYTIIPVGNP